MNTNTALQIGTIYHFSSNNDSLSKGEKRFEIIQSFKGIPAILNVFQYCIGPNPASDKITVNAAFEDNQDVVQTWLK